LNKSSELTVGWREWVSLPGLGIPAMKAKIDTGAKTSCLHAFAMETYSEEVEMVRFQIHPIRKRDYIITCEAPILDRRIVRDSGGHIEERIVITADVMLGPVVVTTPITLTSREDMLFRMLVGRRTLSAAGVVVDVAQSYSFGRHHSRELAGLYTEGQK
jgi:hypothetical protein